MNFLDLLLGRPIPTSAEHNEKIGPISGVPIFGLDALGSAAYGPEAALTLLLPLGAAGIHYIVPVSTAIIILLGVVIFLIDKPLQPIPRVEDRTLLPARISETDRAYSPGPP